MASYDKEAGILARYVCGYCGNTFLKKARQSQGQGGKRSKVSNTIKCEWCKNHLKTWDDIAEIIEVFK